MNLQQKLDKMPLERIPELLSEYEDDIENYKEKVEMKGKTLEVANREQAADFAFYDERRIEVHSVLKYLANEVNRVRGKLFKGFTENYSHALAERAKERYIDQEEAYLRVQKVYLQVEELYEKYQGVLRAYEQRGYILRNITQIRVNELQNYEIY